LDRAGETNQGEKQGKVTDVWAGVRASRPILGINAGASASDGRLEVEACLGLADGFDLLHSLSIMST